MLYILIGISLVILLAVLFFADKFAPNSALMSGFKQGTYGKFVIGVSIAAVLSISYGVFHQATYEPPFLVIETTDRSYVISGNIGEIGYYAGGLVKKDQPANIHLVSWEKLNLDNSVEITIQYPSGEKEHWNTSVTQVKNGLSEHGIKEVYKLSPFTFPESGEAILSLSNKEFSIDVK